MAVIEYHSGDTLQNEYSLARISYYNMGTFPTVNFDGVLSYTGGSSSQSMYNTYVPFVNQRNAIPSDYTIDIELEENGLDYTANITMENVGGASATSLVLHFVITESHMPISWGLGETVNGVSRLMVPNQFGTVLDFTSGAVQTEELNFTIANFWNLENLEVVAFIQNNASKEIKQGTKKFLEIPLYDTDAEAKAVVEPAGIYCDNSVEPIVIIKNRGAENLTSCDIEYSINEGNIEIYNWTGDLSFKHEQEITLGEILFTPELVNTFEFSVSNPNGESDPNPDNNNLSAEFESAPQLLNEIVIFELKTDYYPAETTWEVSNSEGDVVYSGGPYGGPQTLYYETWEFGSTDCFSFTIFDSQGDGICCSFGTGYYKLMGSDSLVFADGGQFYASESKPFVPYVENILSADFMADTTSIVEGQSVIFSDLSSGEITDWYWEFEGGEPTTSEEQNPTVTYSQGGLYNVSLTISNGGNSNTMVKEDYIEVDHITAVTNLNKTGIQVFPNPSTGKVFIQGVEDATIRVYSIAGTVMAEYHNFDNLSIDLSNLKNGIYFVHITMKDKVISKKINLIK